MTRFGMPKAHQLPLLSSKPKLTFANGSLSKRKGLYILLRSRTLSQNDKNQRRGDLKSMLTPPWTPKEAAWALAGLLETKMVSLRKQDLLHSLGSICHLKLKQWGSRKF